MSADLAALIVREIEDSIAAKQKLMLDRSLVAQHLSAEFVSRFNLDRAPLASLVLATTSSAISAIGNDYGYGYGYDQVFSRELEAVARPGDVFIPITTSGNSPNALKAIKVATHLELRTVCLRREWVQ